MVQYENEYSISDTPESLAVLPKIFGMGEVLDSDDIDTLSTDLFSDYMEYIKQQFTDAGIAVPLMINDAVPAGNWAPNTGKGAADIYTIDDYPFLYGFTCTHTALHTFSPTTPLGIAEFQGGQPEAWFV